MAGEEAEFIPELTPEERVTEDLRLLKQAYQRTLMSPDGQRVLVDLMKFCRGGGTAFDPNPRITDLLIGRQEVWLRIQEYLNLSPQDLFAIKTGRPLKP